MVMIKVCGMNDPDLISKITPDFIGIIVLTPDSRRNVPLNDAKEMLKKINKGSKKVLVTRNKDIDKLMKIDELKPDYIQLHSSLNYSEVQKIRSKISSGIITLITDKNLADIEGIIQISDFVIADSGINGKYGGSGIENDWNFVSSIRKMIPEGKLIASGGINPSNMEKVFRITKADVLDASSGLEINGKKDLILIEEFINRGRLLK